MDPMTSGVVEPSEVKKRHAWFVARESKRRQYPTGHLFNNLLDTSVRCLKESPYDFRYAVGKLVRVRHTILLQEFCSDFECGLPGEKMPSKFEVPAPDWLNQLNHMLEWINSSISAENVLVCMLLCPMLEHVPLLEFRFYKILGLALKESELLLNFVQDKIFQIFCSPLFVVAQRILHSPLDVKTSFKLSLELESYSSIVRDHFVEEIQLTSGITALYHIASENFHEILTCHLLKLFDASYADPFTLSLPEALTKGPILLAELYAIHGLRYQTEARMLLFDYVNDVFLCPLLRICEHALARFMHIYLSGTSQSHHLECDAAYWDSFSALETDDRAIDFLVKCLCAILGPLMDIRSEKSEKCVAQLEQYIMGCYGRRVKEAVDAILEKGRFSKHISDYLRSAEAKESPDSIVEQLLLEEEETCTASSSSDEETSSQKKRRLDTAWFPA